MKRRELLKTSAAFGLMAVVPSFAATKLLASTTIANNDRGAEAEKEQRPDALRPPEKGPIPVAFVISEGAVVIDFAGPWEVFQDTHTVHGEALFHLYTVAETSQPV